MAVSDELLCSFELLKPLDSSALKSHIKKGRNKRQNMLNSPVGTADLYERSQLTVTPSLQLCLRRAIDHLISNGLYGLYFGRFRRGPRREFRPWHDGAYPSRV
jgi:hypothetical protein